jgi:hypothetical protein
MSWCPQCMALERRGQPASSLSSMSVSTQAQGKSFCLSEKSWNSPCVEWSVDSLTFGLISDLQYICWIRKSQERSEDGGNQLGPKSAFKHAIGKMDSTGRSCVWEVMQQKGNVGKESHS